MILMAFVQHVYGYDKTFNVCVATNRSGMHVHGRLEIALVLPGATQFNLRHFINPSGRIRVPLTVVCSLYDLLDIRAGQIDWPVKLDPVDDNLTVGFSFFIRSLTSLCRNCMRFFVCESSRNTTFGIRGRLRPSGRTNEEAGRDSQKAHGSYCPSSH